MRAHAHNPRAVGAGASSKCQFQLTMMDELPLAARREMARVERKLKRQARVLDVGCGTASHLAALAEYGAVTGVDFSARVVELCKELYAEGGVTYVQGDARDLSMFESGSFDVILDKGCVDCFVSSETATYEQRNAYLSEVARLLDPGCGVFVLCSVCGVDIVTLMTSAIANRSEDDRCGATREPMDAWEIARSAEDMDEAQRFVVKQIISSNQKHIFRCVPWGRDLEDEAGPVSVLSPRPEPIRAATPDDGDFDDATSVNLTLAEGIFCGACAALVAKLHPIPAGGRKIMPNCPRCRANVRRFAMS